MTESRVGSLPGFTVPWTPSNVTTLDENSVAKFVPLIVMAVFTGAVAWVMLVIVGAGVGCAPLPVPTTTRSTELPAATRSPAIGDCISTRRLAVLGAVGL